MRKGIAWLCVTCALAMAGCGPRPAEPPPPGTTAAAVSTGDASRPDITGTTSGGEEPMHKTTGSIAASAVKTTSRPGARPSAAVSGPAATTKTRPRPAAALDIHKTLVPCTSEYDDTLLDNPDRGLRLETKLYVSGYSHTGTPNVQPSPAADLDQMAQYYLSDRPQLAQAYFYLDYYKTTPQLPQVAFDRMQEFFDRARKLKIKLLLRFAYQFDMPGVSSTGQTGESSTAVMLQHMRQLAPILAKNQDILHVVQAGFVGAWGEWHSYDPSQVRPDDLPAILRGAVDMTPPGLYVQTRLPKYKKLLEGEPAYYRRLSFHNDCLFGVAHPDSGGLNPGTDQWAQFTAEAAAAPVDGELYWGWSLPGQTLDWQPILRELSEHRFTSFSLHHSYRENGGSYSMKAWQRLTITKNWLKTNGLFFAPGWFEKADGTAVRRSPFEYLRDHLGYKLEGRRYAIAGQAAVGGRLEVSLELVNYGFSAAFNLESGFALLDAGGQAVSHVKAGNPALWHSRDKDHPHATEQLTHTVTAKLPLPRTPGTYRVAFYLKNTLGSFANIGNRLEVVNGYQVLDTIQVS